MDCYCMGAQIPGCMHRRLKYKALCHDVACKGGGRLDPRAAGRLAVHSCKATLGLHYGSLRGSEILYRARSVHQVPV